MTKIAILSDVHGNLTALEAVIQDARTQGVTEYWLLGDLVLPGPGDTDLLELLASLNPTISVRGNWDDCFLEALDGQYGLDDCEEIYLQKLAQYLSQRLSAEEVQSIRDTPLHIVKQIEGLTVSVSHNHPKQNWGSALAYNLSQEELDRVFEDFPCDLAIYGHIHMQVLRYSSKGQLLLNPGSIGNPYYPWDNLRKDSRAQYAILTLDEYGLAVDFRKVPYDLEKEIMRAKKKGLPFFELYATQIRTSINQTHNRPKIEAIIHEAGYIKDLLEKGDCL